MRNAGSLICTDKDFINKFKKIEKSPIYNGISDKRIFEEGGENADKVGCLTKEVLKACNIIR